MIKDSRVLCGALLAAATVLLVCLKPLPVSAEDEPSKSLVEPAAPAAKPEAAASAQAANEHDKDNDDDDDEDDEDLEGLIEPSKDRSVQEKAGIHEKLREYKHTLAPVVAHGLNGYTEATYGHGYEHGLGHNQHLHGGHTHHYHGGVHGHMSNHFSGHTNPAEKLVEKVVHVEKHAPHVVPTYYVNHLNPLEVRDEHHFEHHLYPEHHKHHHGSYHANYHHGHVPHVSSSRHGSLKHNLVHAGKQILRDSLEPHHHGHHYQHHVSYGQHVPHHVQHGLRHELHRSGKHLVLDSLIATGGKHVVKGLLHRGHKYDTHMHGHVHSHGHGHGHGHMHGGHVAYGLHGAHGAHGAHGLHNGYVHEYSHGHLPTDLHVTQTVKHHLTPEHLHSYGYHSGKAFEAGPFTELKRSAGVTQKAHKLSKLPGVGKMFYNSDQRRLADEAKLHGRQVKHQFEHAPKVNINGHKVAIQDPSSVIDLQDTVQNAKLYKSLVKNL